MIKTKKQSAGMKPVSRIVAVLLALMWIAGGLAGLWICINENRVILGIVSLFSVAYGGLWIKVAQSGRKLKWPSAKRK